jgi:hypothetical protein
MRSAIVAVGHPPSATGTAASSAAAFPASVGAVDGGAPPQAAKTSVIVAKTRSHATRLGNMAILLMNCLRSLSMCFFLMRDGPGTRAIVHRLKPNLAMDKLSLL